MRGLRNRYVVVVVRGEPKWNFVHYALHSKYILCLHLHNCIHLHLWTCTCIHLHTCVHLHILLRSCNFFHIFIEYFAVCTEFCLCSGLVKYFLLRFSNVQIVQILLLFNLFPEFIFLLCTFCSDLATFQPLIYSMPIIDIICQF